MGSYRDRFDIIADILRATRVDSKKTRIMNQAHLSHKVLQRYLSELIKSSLISYKSVENNYVLTQKGHEFLENYKKYSKANKSLKNHLDKLCTKKTILDGLCKNK